MSEDLRAKLMLTIHADGDCTVDVWYARDATELEEMRELGKKLLVLVHEVVQ